MRTSRLIESGSRKDQTNFGSDRDVKSTGSSLAGRVLARRYKILKTIDSDSFKAHDLALDQAVIVRQARLTGQCDGNTWGQKVRQLALLRDPNFLNVLDVVSDESGDFVITEHPRGQPIAELLRERSRFDLTDVLRLMTRIAGALDFAATFAYCPNPVSTCWLFTETTRSSAVDSEQLSVSEWPPFFVKLDIWELVRPRKNIAWPSSTLEPQRGDQKGVAVRQAALLTYELLCGEQIKESGVKSWFKPVSELSDAANGVLYDGLQGSPLFENSGCFFHRLESANRPCAGNSKAFHVPALQTREYSVALPGAEDVMRRFNRDTQRLATLVLGAVVFAILVLAVLIPERDPNAADLGGKERQTRGALLVNDNLATLPKDVGLDADSSIGETTSGQATSAELASTVISPHETPSPSMEAAASTQAPVPAPTPEINQPDAQANPSSWSSAHPYDFARVIRAKIHNLRHRSSVRIRFVDVKMRLIALWHQSLARSQRPRSWTGFQKSNKGER